MSLAVFLKSLGFSLVSSTTTGSIWELAREAVATKRERERERERERTFAHELP